MKNEEVRNFEWKESMDFVANKEIFTSGFPCACDCASAQCLIYVQCILVNKTQMAVKHVTQSQFDYLD